MRINRAAPVRQRKRWVLPARCCFPGGSGGEGSRRSSSFCGTVGELFASVVSGYRSEYERILRQRNSKSMQRKARDENAKHALGSQDEQLSTLGAQLLSTRFRLLQRFCRASPRLRRGDGWL